MNLSKYKRIIAREWLLFIVAVILGIIISNFAFFYDSSQYQLHRKDLYNSLEFYYDMKNWYKDVLDKKYSKILGVPFPEIKDIREKYPQYNDLDDSTLASKLATKYPKLYGDLPKEVHPKNKQITFISYKEFSTIMDDNSRRKIFYDTVNTKYYLGNYDTFESKVSQPTLFSSLTKLFDQLFSRWYWMNTLFSLLMPYLIVQLIRSVYYSIKVLVKNNTP